jgi:hypothetical protein
MTLQGQHVFLLGPVRDFATTAVPALFAVADLVVRRLGAAYVHCPVHVLQRHREEVAAPINVEAVLEADALVALPGWEECPIAAVWAELADVTGAPVLPLDLVLSKS